MSTEGSIEKMKTMKLYGMHRAYEVILESSGKELTVDETISYLIDSEFEDRYNRKLSRLLSSAKFRYTATLKEVNFRHPRNLDKNSFMKFSKSNWVRKGESIIISGSTGVGKSYLACALGYQSCIDSYKTMYLSALDLFTKLKMARVDGTYIKEIEKIKKQELLIIDDFGIDILDQMSRLSLLEILEDRHGRKSTLICSQVPTKKWHSIIGEATIADAICDRLFHTAHKINLKGESLRKKKTTLPQGK